MSNKEGQFFVLTPLWFVAVTDFLLASPSSCSYFLLYERDKI